MTDRPLRADRAEDALKIAAGNPCRKYPAPGAQGSRLYPIAKPQARPSFGFAPGDSVYAIGSCFARNIEGALDTLGLEVLSRKLDYAALVPAERTAFNYLNKYSIHSMLNDLEWALDPASYPGAEALFEMPGRDGMIFDPQIGIPKLPGPLSEVLAFKEMYFASVAQIFEADIVILTLGYVETWYDRQLGRYLNLAPPGKLIKAHPDRFEFRVLSHDDVLGALRRFCGLLTAHRSKPLRMLVTVSPVPLASTFRDVDILTANAYSKSVQRAALEHFVAETDGVDYFPSYESVTLSNPTLAWRGDDYRHVSPDLVMQIMDNVLRSYMGADAPALQAEAGASDSAIVAEAKLLNQAKDWPALAALLDADPGVMERNPDLIGLRANAYRKMNDLPGCYAILRKGHELAPHLPGFVERMVWVSLHQGDRARAREWFAHHRTHFPERHEIFRSNLGRALNEL